MMNRYILLLLIILLTPTLVISATPKHKYLEAVFISKFLNYIEWKETESDSNVIKIAVFQDEEMFKALTKVVTNSHSKSKKIEILNIQEVKNLQNNKFNIYFSHVLPEPPLPTSLLITDSENASLQHWNIVFKVNESNRLRFDINAKMATEKQIQISSRLLKLGSEVIK